MKKHRNGSKKPCSCKQKREDILNKRDRKNEKKKNRIRNTEEDIKDPNQKLIQERIEVCRNKKYL